MKIAILLKQVPDTCGPRRLDLSTGVLDRAASEVVIDEIGERALEVALAQKDGDRTVEIVVITMGPAAAKVALRKALSMGADRAIHILDDALAGADAVRTARVITAALLTEEFDLIIAGDASTDGRGGVVPAMVAELIGLPFLNSFDTIEISSDQVSGTRTTDREELRACAHFPAIVSVTERMPEPRFPNFKGILSAKRKTLTVLAVEDLDHRIDADARSVVLRTSERAPRSAGTIVVDQGDVATQLVEFLATERLI
jgi:electron transfer flavoprotein beta subunit